MSSFKIKKEIARLNPMQREAVLNTNGPLLVLAGAGSGKTRVITMRVAHLIDKGVEPAAVLAVTFTNKAAKEMKVRISSMVGRDGKPLISTFHSLCLRILRKEIDNLGYGRDFTIYDTSDQLALMRNLMQDVRIVDKSFKVESVMERLSKAKNGIVTPDDMEESETDDLGAVSQTLSGRYQEALKAFNAVDFDDLLILTVRLFKEHPRVLDKYRETFKYMMVDEYQDTNKTQYDLIKLLAGENRNICVVGDDDQSIYKWRGADINNILNFEKDFPGAKIVRLEQNYRSRGNILRAANGVIKNNRKRMGKSLWTERGLGASVRIRRLDDMDAEAEWIADRISLLKYEKKLSYDDFAVIYRANILSRPIEEALRRERIPYTVIGGTSYFERREIKDLAAYLKIIANTNDNVSLLRIANIPKRGLGAASLERLSAHAGDSGRSLLDVFKKAETVSGLGDKAMEAAAGLADLIEHYRELFNKGRAMNEALNSLVRETGYKDYLFDLFKTPDVAAKKTANVDMFIESLSHYEGSEPSPTLTGFLETMALTDMDESKDDEAFGVTLISLHSSKGLEFPVVFMAGVEENILPHKKSLHEEGGLEEERRLFYVGITRAMNELYLTYTDHRVKYGKSEPSSPSRFLEEIPEEVVERTDKQTETDPVEAEVKAKDFFANIQAMLGD